MALLPLLQQKLHEIPFNPVSSLIFLVLFLYFYQHTKRRKPNLPPSPQKLPIIGNFHQLGTLPHRSFQALSKKHGPLMFLNLGTVPTLVVSSADMAREMLKTHDAIFSNRPKTSAANSLLYGCTDVVFSPYGEYWRQVRKICVLELLSLKSVQSFQHVREEEVEALITTIRNSSLKGASVNLSEMLMEISSNVVSTCVGGQRYEEKDGQSRVGHLSRRVSVLMGAFCIGDFFPFLGWIDVLTGFVPCLEATFKELDAFFDQVIQEHRIRKINDDEPNKKDFTDILLKLYENDMLDVKLTEDNLKAILLDMFVAATDTTSTTLEWLMAELMKNPNVMKKVQEEIRRVVTKKSKIDMNNINQMDYLKCVVKETLRLHPPVPLSLPRETSASVKFGGYDIPAKTMVFLNTWAIQRDPTVWQRPEEFLPERFQDNPIDFKGQDFEFLPFGGGRRGCPGFTFGIVSVEYVIANILYCFDWKFNGANEQVQDFDMSEVNGVTVTKKVPLNLVPIMYSP